MRIALDLGGTLIKIGFFEDGKPNGFLSIPARSEETITMVLDRVVEAVSGRIGERLVDMVGLATPGIVDSEARRILSINRKYADAVGFDFTAWCLKKFGCPLVMENDANAALLGEVSRGCAIGQRDAVMMILGTGIGTAAIMDGRLVRGRHFQAGILGGHFVVDLQGRTCTCGGKGCLETLAGSGVLEDLVRGMPGFEESTLSHMEWTGMEGIIASMEKGDGFAAGVFDGVMEALGAGITNLVHAYDPEVVILSGGVMKGKARILPALELKVRERVWTPWGQVRFLVAEDPDSSVLLGLAARMEEAR
ncbi:MAG TPA: ROK family protein [Clostridiaceae bacterium]|nr:ROK family protein [Clostridiaceae bacterium]